MTTAIAADGTRHEFPEGTPDTVIDKAMRTYAQGAGGGKSTLGGTAKALGSGVRQGAVGLPGMLGSIQKLLADTGERFVGPEALKGQEEWLDKLGIKSDPMLANNPALRDYQVKQYPTSADMNAAYESKMGPAYQPQGPIEQGAMTVGSYAPAAIGGAGPLQMLARVGTTALGGETGKAVAGGLSGGDPLAEQWGQIGGSALGLGGAGPLERMATPKPKVEGPIPDSVYLQPGASAVGATSVNAPAPIKATPVRSFGRIETLARRGGIKNTQDLIERAKPYEDAGVTPSVAQILGEQGLTETKALVSAPGKTAQRAKSYLDEHKPEVQPAAIGAVDKSFGAKTEFDAASVADNILSGLKPEYNAVLDVAQPTPTNLSALNSIWEKRAGPRLKSAAAADIAEKIAAEGFTPETIPPGRLWQLRKEALDNEITKAETNQNAGLVRSLTTLKNDALLPAMDNAFQGYGNVRSKWATQEANLKAIEIGKSWLSTGKTAPSWQAIKSTLAKMTESQREHAKIGMRSELQRLIESQPADHATLSRILESGGQINRIKAVLGEAEGANLVRRLRVLRDHAGELTYKTPRSGSPTAPLFAQYADMIHQGAELTGHGSPIGMAVRGLQIAADPGKYLQNFEGVRNVTGQRLLSPATPQTMRDLGARLEQQNAARAAANRARLQGGLFGAQFGQQAGQ